MLNNITSIAIMKEFDKMIDKGDRCVKYSDVVILIWLCMIIKKFMANNE